MTDPDIFVQNEGDYSTVTAGSEKGDVAIQALLHAAEEINLYAKETPSSALSTTGDFLEIHTGPEGVKWLTYFVDMKMVHG